MCRESMDGGGKGGLEEREGEGKGRDVLVINCFAEKKSDRYRGIVPIIVNRRTIVYIIIQILKCRLSKCCQNRWLFFLFFYLGGRLFTGGNGQMQNDSTQTHISGTER